jgi:hypothetical protein
VSQQSRAATSLMGTVPVRVSDLRRVGREGRAGDEALKDRILLGARRRVDLVGRKTAQPLEGWNVVVGSCPIGQLVGDQGEKAESQYERRA